VREWNRAVSRAYLRTYCEKLQSSGLLPAGEDKLRALLLAHVLHQVMGELGAELESRSDRLHAPLQAVVDLICEPVTVRAPAASEAKPEIPPKP
jgi:predicted trehalose synthase